VDRSPVLLRPLSVDDVDHVMTWVNDKEVIGNLAVFAGKPLTRDDELQWIEKVTRSAEDRVFSIVSSADGRYLGQVGLHQIFRRSGAARASLVVSARAEWGKGYGSAALCRVLDEAFGNEALHKVWLMVFATNTRARRTYARVGFQEEGVLREEYFHEGKWHDMVRMSVLAHEWQRA
jgi:RimJ/RimL family protein N-acetyltransferase